MKETDTFYQKNLRNNMKYILTLSLFLCPMLQSNELYDYCTQRVDEISYDITHGLYKTQVEKQYLVGQMDAYFDVIHHLEIINKLESSF